jgi:hypothetical protein
MDNVVKSEMAEFEGLSDHFLMRMYEFIRNEVHCDVSAGTRFVGSAARQRADRLLEEINRRGLYCQPINWPDAQRETTDAKRPLDP